MSAETDVESICDTLAEQPSFSITHAKKKFVLVGCSHGQLADRSVIEVRPSQAGWMVIFRDANASCEQGSWWPGACRFGNRVFRDVYACVEWNWSINQMGYSGESEALGEEDLCQAPAPERPTFEPTP